MESTCSRAPSNAWRAMVREANQATHDGNDRRGDHVPAQRTRCECGDPTCQSTVRMARAEFDALCATADRFVLACASDTSGRPRAAGGGAIAEIERADEWRDLVLGLEG